MATRSQPTAFPPDRRSAQTACPADLLTGPPVRLAARPTAAPSPVLLATLLGLIGATSTVGQAINGQVVDSISGLPVGAGFVVLIGEDDLEISRTLTRADGGFSLHLPVGLTGQLRVRSERIGYRVSVTESFPAPTRDIDGLVVYIRALPRQLEAIEARDESECRIRPSESERTAMVWEEIRKALAAASWTASTQPYRVVSNISTVDMDGQQREVRSETHRPSIGLSTNPFVSRSPAELVRSGYVAEELGSYVYTSPDAHVLQSEGFLDTHCFRLANREDEALVGLAFGPAPSRTLPDVEGILWIDRESWELRSLEYQYTNLPEDLRAGDPAGGTVEFLPLPSGAWIVHRWEIHFPTAFREERIAEFDRRSRRRVEASRSVGGEVMKINERSGALVYETSFSEVVGTVRDESRGGSPLPGAVVRVSNAWFADTADQEGRFHLRVPLSGEYAITVSHSRIDSLVFGPPPVRVYLTRGQFAQVSINVPTLDELFDAVCTDRPPSPDHRVLVGAVTDSATRTPVEGIPVVARWQHITPRLDFFNRHTVATTDAQGRFALCGLEVGRPAMVYAASEWGRSEVLRVGFEPGHIEIGPLDVRGGEAEVFQTPVRIWRRDLTIRGGSGQTTLLAGSVVDATTGEPLIDVDVRVVNASMHTRTDSMGMFQFTGLYPGSHRIALTKGGFAIRSGEIVVERDQPTIIDVEDLALTPVPQLVGVIREVETERPIPLAWMTLVSGSGDSLTRARSDSLGRFRLTAPRDGSYSVSVVRLGYAPLTLGPFDLRAGQAPEAVVTMSPGVFALDPINVTAEAPAQYLSQVGFYRRQRANRGHFMDRVDIEERLGASANAFQLLAALPGVGITDARAGESGSRVKLNRGTFSVQGCSHGPLIYVDGFRVEYGAVGSVQPRYDAMGMVVRPEDIQAIEVYRTPSQIPVQYSGPESACGVILIWTWKGSA